jgi:hypothetical protein
MSLAIKSVSFSKEKVMSLSSRSKSILTVAMADKKSASEVSAAIDALHAIAAAAHVANNAAASAVTIALSTADTYSDAAVNSAVNAALVSVIADINSTRSQINAILASLEAASIML